MANDLQFVASTSLVRARIVNRVQVDQKSNCWIWQRCVQGNGYGRMWNGKQVTYAHRVSYAVFIGPIPGGMDLDHLCRNRRCVNPSHLEPVSRSENLRRGESGRLIAAAQRIKTHCPSGHPYSGDNMYLNKEGKRVCRTCGRERWRKRNVQ